MSAEKYESPPLEVTIARAYRDRIGGNCPYFSFGFRQVVCCKGDGHYDDEFHGLMLDAKRREVVNQQEWHEFWNIHTVLKGEDWQDGSVVYATVDIAIIVEDHHINKAATRAGILQWLAQEQGVSLAHASLEFAKLYRYFREDALEEIGCGKLPLQEET